MSLSAPPCQLIIQPSPHCFDSQNKKTTTLHTKHTTPNTTSHTNYTLQTRIKTPIFQLTKLAVSVTVTAAVSHTLPSLPQPLLFPSNQITWFAIWFCDWLVVISWQKAVFTISSCTRHKAYMTAIFGNKHGIYPKSNFGHDGASAESGGGGGLAASYTRTSSHSDSSLSSSRIRISSDPNGHGLDLFSLINPQQSF